MNTGTAEIPGHMRTATGELMPKNSSDNAKIEKEKQPGGLIRRKNPLRKERQKQVGLTVSQT